MITNAQSQIDLSQEEKEAFYKGYNDYMVGLKARRPNSLTPPPFAPPPGFEAAYQEGWDIAASEAIAVAGERGRRGEGSGYIKIGAALLIVGIAITIFSSGTILAYVAVGLGLLIIVIGASKYLSSKSRSE